MMAMRSYALGLHRNIVLVIVFVFSFFMKTHTNTTCTKIVPFSYIPCFGEFNVNELDLYSVNKLKFHKCAQNCAEEFVCSSFVFDSRHGTCAFYRPKSKVTSSLPEQHYYMKFETEDECKSAPEPECYRYVNGRPLYTGRKVTTENGITCQRWDAQTPHTHTKIYPALFPEDSVSAAENFCRNADDTGAPWCYTVDPKQRWQECGIQLCTN